MKLTHILSPLNIAGVRIKNRVVRTAHVTAIGGGAINEDFISYHEARARGGVGLSILEGLAVHPSSPATLNIFDSRLADSYPRMAERLHAHGMMIFQQLMHTGQHSGVGIDGGPPWGPSDYPGYMSGVPALQMTGEMIHSVVEGFAKAAQSAIKWGADGVEVHCAHGFLVQQFLSPLSNSRDDEYGGSFENRSRFMLEVLRAVRAAVPDGQPVGVRIGADLVVGGVGVAENIRAAQLMIAHGLIDYINVSAGNYQTMSRQLGGMEEPPGFELNTAEPICEAVNVPTIVVGRFRTLQEADEVIRAGKADMVALVRATIADPDLVRKTIEGRAEEVRPCIGCNQGCIGQVLGPPHRMGCTVNAAVGHETKIGDDRVVPVAVGRHVLVIGGGPAGMEAARVARLRGHRVILAEAMPDLGGTLNLAAGAPGRAGIRDIAVWLEQEIYRLGVEVRLGSFMELEDALKEAPDVIILATGSTPRMDGTQLSNPGEVIGNFNASGVISSNDLFSGESRDLGVSAVVIDDTGHYEALAAAEYLVHRGLSVTFVTRYVSLAPRVESSLVVDPALRRMVGRRFSVRLRSRCISIDDGTALIGPIHTSSDTTATERVSADTVVFISPNRPNRELSAPLQAHGMRVEIIGDANSPRFLPVAIREGNAAGLRA